MLCVAGTSLDLSAVDFNNVDEINGFAYALIDACNSIGLFMSATPLQSREAIQIYQTAKGWTNTVKRQLMVMQPADALKLIDTYEFVYRIAFQCPVKTEELNKVKLAAFDAMIHGDKAVDEYLMFRVIRNAVRQRDKAFFDKTLTWSCIAEERWHKEAARGFDHTRLTDYDIISRVTLLLESDLLAYEGRNQDQFKKSLVERHRHYLDGYTAPDRRTENALCNFRLLVPRYIAEDF